MEVALLVPLLNVTTSVARILLGPLADLAVKQLKDGDVVNEWVCEQLKNVKSKLECLSLKELHTSKSSLKEGIQLLHLALEKSNEDENKTRPREASKISSDTVSDLLKAASSLTTQGSNIFSTNRFLAAKDSFKLSREEATRSFNNENLCSEDRIMACKLRVTARILESGLEDPEIAIAACLVSLKELHGLPGIQDMFSSFLKKGVKSWLKSKEQLENIKTVLSINRVLFDFASKHSSEYSNVFTWPGIKLKDRKVNPILHTREILEKVSSSEEFLGLFCRFVAEHLRSCRFVVNSRSELITIDMVRISIIKTTGEGEVVSHVRFPIHPSRFLFFSETVAVDCDDNIYAVRCFQERDGFIIKCKVALHVFDENHDLKHDTTLDFLHVQLFTSVEIAVDKNENIILIEGDDNHVYICNSRGQLKFQFERDSSKPYNLITTINNDIMIRSGDCRSVHLYTTEGNLKSTFKTPEGHKIKEVAFHHGIGKVIILTDVKEQRHNKSLLCYSETGELEYLEVLCDEASWYMNSHPSGVFAVQFGAWISFI